MCNPQWASAMEENILDVYHSFISHLHLLSMACWLTVRTALTNFSSHHPLFYIRALHVQSAAICARHSCVMRALLPGIVLMKKSNYAASFCADCFDCCPLKSKCRCFFRDANGRCAATLLKAVHPIAHSLSLSHTHTITPTKSGFERGVNGHKQIMS